MWKQTKSTNYSSRFIFRFLFQSRRYDSRTTIFSPEGKSSSTARVPRKASRFICDFSPLIASLSRPRPSAGRLYQVEYAMEAIGHAGSCLGILASDGVLLAAERRNVHKLLDDVFSEKIYKLNE